MVDMDALTRVVEDAGFPVNSPEEFTESYLAFCYFTQNGLAKKEVALYGLAYPEGIYPQSLLDDIAAAAGEPPEITTSSLPGGTEGVAYNQTVEATGDEPITWSATGLPTGLSINESTGAITGTPSEPDTFEAEVTATNAAGSDTKPFTIVIAGA